MFRVAVLMSTYNGEKYLAEQIESILNQSDVQVDLYVRDDSSADSTVDILRKIKAGKKNIHLNAAQNVGVGNSFMRLVYSVPDTYDYYAFADQDDVWDSNKLIEAIKCLETSGKNLYVSNQLVTDKNLSPTGLRFDYIPDVSTLSVICNNPVAGCTMVFSRNLKMRLSSAESRPRKSLLRNRIHDVWVDAVASLSDDIFYDKRAFINYRQHENNVVGARKETISDRLKSYRKKVMSPEKRNGRSRIAKELLRCFPEEAKKNSMVAMFADSENLKNKVKIIANYKKISHYTHESFAGLVFKVMAELF